MNEKYILLFKYVMGEGTNNLVEMNSLCMMGEVGNKERGSPNLDSRRLKISH